MFRITRPPTQQFGFSKKRNGFAVTLSRDRGASVVELAIWAPLVVLLLALLVYTSKADATTIEVDTAVRAAALASSNARNPTDAHLAAKKAVETLESSKVCSQAAHTVDTSNWAEGTVTVTVTCTPISNEIDFEPKPVTKSWTESLSLVRQLRTSE